MLVQFEQGHYVCKLVPLSTREIPPLNRRCCFRLYLELVDSFMFVSTIIPEVIYHKWCVQTAVVDTQCVHVTYIYGCMHCDFTLNHMWS